MSSFNLFQNDTYADFALARRRRRLCPPTLLRNLGYLFAVSFWHDIVQVELENLDTVVANAAVHRIVLGYDTTQGCRLAGPLVYTGIPIAFNTGVAFFWSVNDSFGCRLSRRCPHVSL